MNHLVLRSLLFSSILLGPGSALAANTIVEVGHGTFSPAAVTIEAGDSVDFKSTQMMPGGHTVVISELGATGSGLAQGETWTYTFEEAGTYHAEVKEHPGNTAEIIVQPGN